MEEIYHQMTFEEYLNIKEEIKTKIQGMAADYISIGYRLRQIEETQAYRQDGYRTLSEFAKQEYGLSPSATSRFIDINKMFSVGGYSPELVPEFAGYGVSKLSEMLQLTEDDRSLVKAGTTVAEIREMKRLERGENIQTEQVAADIMIPEEAVPEDVMSQESEESEESQETRELTEEEKDMRNVLLAFFQDEEGRLQKVWENIDNQEKVSEIMAPSGNKTFRKGLYMLFLYSFGEGAALKVFKKQNRRLTWQELTEEIKNLYQPYAAGGNIWENCYGRPEEKSNEKNDAENAAKPQKDLGLQEKSLATSQEVKKTVEKPNQIRENDQIEGQKNLEEYFDENGNYEEPEENDESPNQIRENRELESMKKELRENLEETRGILVESRKVAEQARDAQISAAQAAVAAERSAEQADMRMEKKTRTISLTRRNNEIYWMEKGVTIMHEEGDSVISSVDSLLSRKLAGGCSVEIIIREGQE